MTGLWQDLRYGARMLLKKPGFTLISILTLALGIGANTAIFSVFDRILVRTLPVAEPERLVNVVGHDEKGNQDTSFSYPVYRDYRDQNDVFASLLAFSETPMNLSASGEAERLTGVLVSGNYFDTLGVTPALGRTFSPDEDQTPGTHPVVVISYGLWQRRFATDPQLVGRTITLNTHSFTVIGIAPAEFRGSRRGVTPDVYVPIQMMAQAWPTRTPADLSNRGFSWLNVMGRLKTGVSPVQAQSSMSTLSSAIAKTHPGFTWPFIALPDGSQGETSDVSDLGTPLKLLMATVALVLLIACVNLANLLLARAHGRSREIAVRLAVGATRGRLIRQMLTESLLLALLGGVLGVLFAVWLADAMAALSPPSEGAIPLLDARLDWRVLAFTAALSVGTGLLFGLIPAWQASRSDLIVALKEDVGTHIAGFSRIRLRGAMVSAQIALSLVVLVCAGLCLRSLQKLQSIDAGFDAAKVLVMGLNLSLNGYKPEQGRQFQANLLERVSALPGVEAASLARIIPLSGSGMRLTVGIEGYTPPDNKPINLNMNIVGPGYLSALKVPLVAGREFRSSDNAAGQPVVIINEAAAKAYWPSQVPVGKHLMIGTPGAKPQAVEIIGVAGNSRYRSLTEPFRPGMLLPAAQNYAPDLSLHVRTAGDRGYMIEGVRRELRALDAQLPITRIRTLEDQRLNSLYSERMIALLLSVFGGLALALAALGIYGVMSYAVTQRTREIGIRLALGAQNGTVLRLVLWQGGWLIVAGVVIGLAGSFAATRLMRSFLYQISTTDPMTFVIAPFVLAGVAFLASYFPARRATKTDPIVALRCE